MSSLWLRRQRGGPGVVGLLPPPLRNFKKYSGKSPTHGYYAFMGGSPAQKSKEYLRAQEPCRAAGVPELDGLAGEQHYAPAQLARLWGFSPTKIRRIFEGETGVLRIGAPSRRCGHRLKRSYFTLRIPQSVAERVHRRLTCSDRRSGGPASHRTSAIQGP